MVLPRPQTRLATRSDPQPSSGTAFYAGCSRGHSRQVARAGRLPSPSSSTGCGPSVPLSCQMGRAVEVSGGQRRAPGGRPPGQPFRQLRQAGHRGLSQGGDPDLVPVARPSRDRSLPDEIAAVRQPGRQGVVVRSSPPTTGWTSLRDAVVVPLACHNRSVTRRSRGHPRSLGPGSTSTRATSRSRQVSAPALPKLTMRVRFPSPAPHLVRAYAGGPAGRGD
jgi:hypothetical protein